MILDQLENGAYYPFGPAWKRAFEFLVSLTPASQETEYRIQGDDMFARVMSYETRSLDDAVLEAHRKYVDIQAVLIGGEAMEWFPREGLVVATPYDESKDAAFYRRTVSGPVRVNVFPGTFAVFFPQDAHMPSLMIGEKPEWVKKVVVKIRIELLTAERDTEVIQPRR